MRLEEPIDATHAESIAVRNQISREFGVLRSMVARWEPRPMPPGFGGLDVRCPDSAGWVCGRPYCPRCTPGLARIDGERFGDEL